MLKKLIIGLNLIFCLSFIQDSYALSEEDPLGQTIQIYTRFHSFFGKPTWELIIRDVDTGQVFPYIYDIERGDNFWLAFTYGRNYLITVSRMYFVTYRSCTNTFRKYITEDFCCLESRGRIRRAESLYITISGDLSPNPDTYSCHVSSYRDANFSIAPTN